MRPEGIEPSACGLKDRCSLAPRREPLTTELRARAVRRAAYSTHARRRVRPWPATSQRSTRARPARVRSCSMRTAGSSALAQREHEQITPGRAGSSTTRGRSGRTRRGDRRRARARRGRRRRTSRRSGSPTSARRRCCGIARTGEPLHNAIVWQDTRTAALVRELAGEGAGPPARARRAAAVDVLLGPEDRLAAGARARRARARGGRASWRSATIDSWLLWNLTGGVDGGLHATDATNASRTMLMDLHDARLARAEPRADGHPARAAAGDPLLDRAVRRGRA